MTRDFGIRHGIQSNMQFYRLYKAKKHYQSSKVMNDKIWTYWILFLVDLTEAFSFCQIGNDFK